MVFKFYLKFTAGPTRMCSKFLNGVTPLTTFSRGFEYISPGSSDKSISESVFDFFTASSI